MHALLEGTIAIPTANDPEIWKLIGNGAAVALLLAIPMFLTFLVWERRSNRAERETALKDFKSSLRDITSQSQHTNDRLVEHLETLRDSHARIEVKVEAIGIDVHYLKTKAG